MITRTWHGRTRAADAEKYLQYLTETGVAEYRATKGNLGVQIHRSTAGGTTDFWVTSQWESFASIEAFAGQDYERAKYYEEDSRYLLELEPTVSHCETTAFGPTTTLAALTRQFEQLYHGELWLDETLLKKLSEVDAESAVARPAEGIHTLQELVWHIINWRKVLIARLRQDFGYRIEIDSAQDWKPKGELRAEDWKSVLLELEKTQHEIISLLQQQQESLLDTEVGEFGYTYQYLIEGLIHHDLYHLGQIGLVKKLVSLHRPSKGS